MKKKKYKPETLAAAKKGYDLAQQVQPPILGTKNAALKTGGRMLNFIGPGLKKAIKRTPKKKITRATESSHAKRLRRGGFDKPGWYEQSRKYK